MPDDVDSTVLQATETTEKSQVSENKCISCIIHGIDGFTLGINANYSLILISTVMVMKGIF